MASFGLIMRDRSRIIWTKYFSGVVISKCWSGRLQVLFLVLGLCFVATVGLMGWCCGGYVSGLDKCNFWCGKMKVGSFVYAESPLLGG